MLLGLEIIGEALEVPKACETGSSRLATGIRDLRLWGSFFEEAGKGEWEPGAFDEAKEGRKKQEKPRKLTEVKKGPDQERAGVSGRKCFGVWRQDKRYSK